MTASDQPVASQTPSAQTALVLSGGGAAGAYEIGVMKALFGGKSPATGLRKLDPGIFTGTSVGSINASFVLSSPAPDLESAVEHLESIYLNEIAASATTGHPGVMRLRANPLPLLNPANYGDPDLWPRFLRDAALLSADIVRSTFKTLVSQRTLEERIIDLVDLSLLVDKNALRTLIGRHLDPSRITRDGRTLRIMTTNWTDGTVTMFRGEDLAGADGVEIILASAAIPGIYSQVSVDGTLYADGGIVMNSALKPAFEAGANEIHLVYVDPAVKDMQIAPNAGTAEVVARALTIAIAAMVNRDIVTADRINLGLRLMSTPGHAATDQLFESGKAALQMLANIEQRGPGAEKYRAVTIHRYRPDEATPGAIRWLDFSRDRIEQMIESGYLDTVRHDCERQQCILP